MVWYVTEHEWADEMVDGPSVLNLDKSTDWLTHDPSFEWTEDDLAEFEHERRVAEQNEAFYMSYFEMAYGEPFRCWTWVVLSGKGKDGNSIQV